MIKIILNVLWFACVAFLSVFLYLSVFSEVDVAVGIANTVISVIPPWAGYWCIGLLFVSGVCAVGIGKLCKKPDPPAILAAFIDEPTRLKIAGYEKPLFLISQIFFMLWNIHLLARITTGSH